MCWIIKKVSKWSHLVIKDKKDSTEKKVQEEKQSQKRRQKACQAWIEIQGDLFLPLPQELQVPFCRIGRSLITTCSSKYSSVFKSFLKSNCYWLFVTWQKLEQNFDTESYDTRQTPGGSTNRENQLKQNLMSQDHQRNNSYQDDQTCRQP